MPTCTSAVSTVEIVTMLRPSQTLVAMRHAHQVCCSAHLHIRCFSNVDQGVNHEQHQLLRACGALFEPACQDAALLAIAIKAYACTSDYKRHAMVQEYIPLVL
jgi:hypothetical protein